MTAAGDAARRALAEVAGALGDRARADHPLGALTTYRVGGPAALYVEAGDEGDLLAVRAALAGRPVPVLVLGKGSNLLVADAGFPGLAVRLAGALCEIAVSLGPPGAPLEASPMAGSSEAQASGARWAPEGTGSPAVVPPGSGAGPAGGDEVLVRAGGGAGLPVLARRTVEAGLTGLEWAVGVPGSVGGAVRMNAGGHGADTAGCLRRYRWLDLATERGGEDGPERLAFGYRVSSVGPTEVVVWAELACRPGPVAAGRQALQEIVRWRREHQPGGSNAGSVFTNPPGDSAGRLVEAAGLKGWRLGSARVSEKHANFIQADDGGSADDVHRLIEHVRRVVAEQHGVVLQTEVRPVGFPGADNGDVDPTTTAGR